MARLLCDMAKDFRSLKIIAVGAVDTARQVVEYDLEMRDRVAQIHVPLMLDKELTQIINKGEDLLKFKIKPEVKEKLVRHSNGLANVCHQLCLNICFAADIRKKTLG